MLTYSIHYVLSISLLVEPNSSDARPAVLVQLTVPTPQRPHNSSDPSLGSLQSRWCLVNALLLNVALYCSRLLISRTQSSSFPGPAPSSPSRISLGSEIDDRLMQGMGYNEARTVTDSPGLRTWETWPSIERPAGARERSLICVPRIFVHMDEINQHQDGWNIESEGVAHPQRDRRGGWEHEGAERQASGTDGGQDDGAQGRVHDGPPCGKRVGCRARWRGHDQTVGLED